MKTYTIGDIHGRHDALIEVFEKSKFNYDKDKLIVLGDIVDGGSQTKEVIEELLKIKNLIFVIGNHDCLDENTELLTDHGWKKYPEIRLTDRVYSLDTSTKRGAWDKINKIIIKTYSGKMVQIRGNHIDMCVTPNHRVLHQRRVRLKFGKLHYETADKLRSRVKIPITAQQDLKTYPNIPRDIIRLIAWIITDGNISKPTRKNVTPQISIYQSKISNVKKIIRLLNKLKLKYYTYRRDRKINSVCNRNLKSCLPQYTFKISTVHTRQILKYVSEKYILPKWVYDLDTSSYKLFLNTLILGDGSIYRNKHQTMILYGIKPLLEQVQISCILHGYSAYLSKDTRGHYRLNISSIKSHEFDCYNSKKHINYSGIVWCLNVPHSNFMVRRNGKHYFTGNCWFMDWYLGLGSPLIWTSQGGTVSMKSYGNNPDNVPKTHRDFFRKSLKYYIDDKNRLFVHGGFDITKPIEKQTAETLVWDRDIIQYAMKKDIPNYKYVFIGHSTTQMVTGDTEPVIINNLVMVDTGAGWNGKLTIMNVDNMEYWQSKIQKPVR